MKKKTLYKVLLKYNKTYKRFYTYVLAMHSLRLQFLFIFKIKGCTFLVLHNTHRTQQKKFYVSLSQKELIQYCIEK